MRHGSRVAAFAPGLRWLQRRRNTSVSATWWTLEGQRLGGIEMWIILWNAWNVDFEDPMIPIYSNAQYFGVFYVPIVIFFHDGRSSCRCPKIGGLIPLRCGSCKSVRYCSPECQKGHWKAHKKKCRKRLSETRLAGNQLVVATCSYWLCLCWKKEILL